MRERTRRTCLSSALWAKLELRTLDPVSAKEDEASRPSVGEFIPLSREESGCGRKTMDDRMRQAEERAAYLEQEAYDKGFAQGEKDGFELGRKRAENIVSDMKRLFEDLTGLKGKLAKSYEQELLAMVLAIARKVIHLETLKDETLIERTVASALRLAADRSEVSLRINPKDVELMEKVKPGVFARFKDLKGLALSPDPSLTRGGCMLESPCGDVDGRIETQLEHIAQVIDEAFREQSS